MTPDTQMLRAAFAAQLAQAAWVVACAFLVSFCVVFGMAMVSTLVPTRIRTGVTAGIVLFLLIVLFSSGKF